MTPAEQSERVWGLAFLALIEMAKRNKEAPVFQRIAALAERMNFSGPRISVAGPFSAGKTTLINNILGRPILPTGLSETTAIPTVVRRGDSERLLLREGLVWNQANEKELREFLNLQASKMSHLFKKYIDKQDEAIYENPLAPEGVELLDLPGISSTHKALETKASEALLNSNGIIWVADATQGLTASDLDYITENIPEETPILIVLTHMDLIPPSDRKEVLDVTEKNVTAKKIGNVLGVIGAEKETSIAGSQELKRLLKDAGGNDRLLPAIEEGIQTLEKELEEISKEAEVEVNEALKQAGLTKKDLDDFVSKLVSLYKRALSDLNTCVTAPHRTGAQIDKDILGKWYDKWLEKFWSLAPYEKEVYEKLTGLDSSTKIVWSAWSLAYHKILGNLTGCYRALYTACWRFEVAYGDVDIGSAFKKFWDWKAIKNGFIESYELFYDLFFGLAIGNKVERHPISGLLVSFLDLLTPERCDDASARPPLFQNLLTSLQVEEDEDEFEDEEDE
ncbi:MAG: dynamin family protein, partial [candidate division WOR-3 bacterium]